MTFDEVLDQVRELLQQRGRVTYRALKLRYQLDDEMLAGVTDELIEAERVAHDEEGKVLVWVGKGINEETEQGEKGENSPESSVQSRESKQIQDPKPVLPAPVPQAQVSLVEGSNVQSQKDQPLDARR